MATASAARKRPRRPDKAGVLEELISPAERAEFRAAIASGTRPIIAVAQRKGGSGKTTCTRTIAELAAIPEAYGLPTLAIDFDSQCSLSKLYLHMETADTDDGM